MLSEAVSAKVLIAGGEGERRKAHIFRRNSTANDLQLSNEFEIYIRSAGT